MGTTGDQLGPAQCTHLQAYLGLPEATAPLRTAAQWQAYAEGPGRHDLLQSQIFVQGVGTNLVFHRIEDFATWDDPVPIADP